MNGQPLFDVIIIGGSYSGLAAGMALGRALRKVLIIDSGNPCNRQTPYSHNFLTNDGKAPRELAATARAQVEQYPTVTFLSAYAKSGRKTEDGFEIITDNDEMFSAGKLLFATGIKELMPVIPGFAECWGISVLHCPYCHGYEVRNQRTGILGNGDYAFEFASLISNWTDDLTLYTNGKSGLTGYQAAKLKEHHINVSEDEIQSLEHTSGYLKNIHFKNGNKSPVTALYTRNPFAQHCDIPEYMGCKLSQEGYIQTDHSQRTTVHGVFACGDNTTKMRTVANAVSMGTIAGMMINKELIEENF